MPSKDCRECKYGYFEGDKIFCDILDKYIFVYDAAEKCYKYQLKPEIVHQRGIEWLTSVCSLTMKSHQHILRHMLQKCFYELDLAPAEEQKYRLLAHLTQTEKLIHKVMGAQK